uniref:PLD phosphodiesterase domain-containing protein n=1 Tax=Setaria digitata TaxID=48799 RepID=A0A915PT16_9BILA
MLYSKNGTFRRLSGMCTLSKGAWLLLTPNKCFTSPNSATTSSFESCLPKKSCTQNCEFHLVESIPENMTFSEELIFPSTSEIWKRLIDSAEKSIDIASFYWSLLPENAGPYRGPSTQDGTDIYNALIGAAKKGIKLRIVQNAQSNQETKTLESEGLAEVRSLNFSNWFPSGVLHTKFWVVDMKHFYLGSANLDWRSLTQVKELGVAIFNCGCLAKDLMKVMDVYWEMGTPGKKLPYSWPSALATRYNADNPVVTALNGERSAVYISSAPPAFCPRGRVDDLSAILQVISTARKFIHISVMDYFPATLYLSNNRYWPVIDDALRKAAYSGIKVKLLISKWKNTRPALFAFLKSLTIITSTLPCKRTYDKKKRKLACIPDTTGSIEARIFIVPTLGDQETIPYARVNHAKYMVTDNSALIGTSNWSADYFINTAGASIVIQPHIRGLNSEIVHNLNEKVFMRDWNSTYASPLSDFDEKGHRIKNDVVN